MTHKPTLNPQKPLKGLKEASVLQYLFFDWPTNLIWNYGTKKDGIVPEILPELSHKDDSGELSEKLAASWDIEVKKGRNSLWYALFRVFGKDFIIMNILSILDIVFTTLMAAALSSYIKFLRYPDKSIREGLAPTFLLSAAVLVSSFFQSHSFFPSTRLGYQVRAGLISLLFKKAIKTSSSVSISTGEAINLISNDVQPFENGAYFLHFIWVGPIQLCIAIVFLWLNIGVSAFVAIGIYALMLPTQSYISSFFGKIRAVTVNLRDSRIKLLTDVLNGIQIVKLNTWEKPLSDKIKNLRDKEYRSLSRANRLKSLNQSLFNSSSYLVQLLTFSTLWLLVVKGYGTNPGNRGAFQPENIFPCVSIFSSIRLIMTLFVPKGFEAYGEMKISVARMESFLLLPDKSQLLTDSDSSKNLEKHNSEDSENAITLKDAWFNWKDESASTFGISPKDSKKKKTLKAKQRSTKNGTQTNENPASGPSSLKEPSDQFSLKNITMSVKHGELCSIVGRVGSGKSSLCNAILGELFLASGTMAINTNSPNSTAKNIGDSDSNHSFKVAYSSQEPWIFGGSIKENILFGCSYERGWFETVVKACSLDRDLNMFEEREDTLIGEKGTTLSGGQRARVSLARAVYTRAKFYILDDPLSAVDPKVGRHIFDNVILGLLKDKTRILVTHQLQFLSKSDKIVIIDQGEIVESGHPSTISKLNEYRIGKDEHTNDSEGENNDENEDDNIDDSHEYSEKKDPFELQNGTSDNINVNANKTDISFNKEIYYPAEDESQNTIEAKSRNHKSKVLGFLHRRNKKSGKKDLEDVNKFKLGDDETSQLSSTSFSTYLQFFRFGASFPLIALSLCLACGMVSLGIYSDYFLSRWSTFSPDKKEDSFNFIKYLLLSISTIIFTFCTNFLLYYLILASSNQLMLKMLSSVILAPISFFQSQPIGRILNRFSKDQSNIDETLATTTVDTLLTGAQTLGILILICFANIYLLILVPIVLSLFVWLRQLYMKSSRQIKRIESTSRSPVYSLLSETLDGLTTVRAFASGSKFVKNFVNAQNVNGRAFFSFISCARWLAFRLDLLNSLLVIVSAFSMLAIRKKLSPGLAALSISYLLNLVGMVQWCVRQSIEVEITFISVERNIAYSKLKPEESQEHIANTIEPPKEWPESGSVVINGLNLKYPSSNKPVLSDIFMNIIPGQKIGIVGRTGAGKSSFVSSIFRLVEPYPNGCISIDGVNISALRLKKLRSSLSMIPQQPFLFEGTLRFNLDPWNEYSDEDLWKALEAASLKEKVESLPEKLESIVVENGKNFSVGERQLFSLCRAILHKKKLVVMDEATANVDLETDQKIQQSIHTHFKDSTVITIAHRLHTVIGAGYHKIAVFEHGKLVEFGHPHELLVDKNSILSKMVSDTGPRMEANLRSLAENEWLHLHSHMQI
ncbi:hypothetical protein BB560_000256 [Smittium megazygosporum]|uniref:Uncharacterized protein n=1 Tax=Smittium megazygosporum TaxID=133381 RepID=A0A2T9ZL18_9FUNG|nr:hypothetical protein BB560_000256 [Smittium megazygosporum]